MPDDYEIDLEGGFSGEVEPTVEKEPDQERSRNDNHNYNSQNSNNHNSHSNNHNSHSNSHYNHNSYNRNQYQHNNRQSPLPSQYNNVNTNSTTASIPPTALLFFNLEWWTNEEDVRGWVVDAGQEKSIKNVVFDEHKVNSKSKGIVYVEFDNPDATKLVYESFHAKQNEARLSLQPQSETPSPEPSPDVLSFTKLSITYTAANATPFRPNNHNKAQQVRSGGANPPMGGGPGQNRSSGNNNMHRNNNGGPGGNRNLPNMPPFNGYPGGFPQMVQYPGGFPPTFGFPGNFYPPQPQPQWHDNNPHGSKRPRQ